MENVEKIIETQVTIEMVSVKFKCPFCGNIVDRVIYDIDDNFYCGRCWAEFDLVLDDDEINAEIIAYKECK
ncbi:MAG: hypothetical protein ACTSYD_02525 [Candidatus Heimdallarchaeaceae archaeon]